MGASRPHDRGRIPLHPMVYLLPSERPRMSISASTAISPQSSPISIPRSVARRRIRSCSFSKARTSIWRMRSRETP